MTKNAPRPAVVDRIVDDVHAVLLVGAEELERIVPVDELPPGTREGTWLRVVFDGDELVSAVIDAEGTGEVGRRVASKMDALRRRGRRPDARTGGAPSDGPSPT